MSYITLRGYWCHIVILIVHVPTDNKNDYVKDSSYEGLECVPNLFSKYHLNIMLGDFKAKVGREDTFQTDNQSQELT